MTLIEMLVAITVLAVVGAVLLPVINSAVDVYAATSTLRNASENCSFAMDRAVRLLRDAPSGSTAGQVGITTAQANEVRFSDGRGLSLSNGVLLIRQADGTTAPLCRNVTAFELTYLDQDGVVSTAATPALTQRINVRIALAETQLTATAVIRARMVTP